MSANPLLAYRQQAIETAPPAQLILLLYDGAIHRVNRALLCFEEQKVQEAREALLKAQEIVAHLFDVLNPDAGPLAQNLSALYDFVYRELIQAHIQAAPDRAANAVQVLRQLRTAWQQVIQRTQAHGA